MKKCFEMEDSEYAVINSYRKRADDYSENYNTMASDALASCVARSSAAMVLTMEDKWFLVFEEKGF